MELKELEAKILYDPTPRNIRVIFKKLMKYKFDNPEEEILIIRSVIRMVTSLLSVDILHKALLGWPEWEEWSKKNIHLIFKENNN